MASYIYQANRPPRHRHAFRTLVSGCLSEVASSDVAGNICQPHLLLRLRAHRRPRQPVAHLGVGARVHIASEVWMQFTIIVSSA